MHTDFASPGLNRANAVHHPIESLAPIFVLERFCLFLGGLISPFLGLNGANAVHHPIEGLRLFLLERLIFLIGFAYFWEGLYCQRGLLEGILRFKNNLADI